MTIECLIKQYPRNYELLELSTLHILLSKLNFYSLSHLITFSLKISVIQDHNNKKYIISKLKEINHATYNFYMLQMVYKN